MVMIWMNAARTGISNLYEKKLQNHAIKTNGDSKLTTLINVYYYFSTKKTVYQRL